MADPHATPDRAADFDREFADRRPRMTDHLAGEILGWPMWRVRLDHRLGYDGATVSSAVVFRIKHEEQF